MNKTIAMHDNSNEIECGIEKHAPLFSLWFFHILAETKSVSRNPQQGWTQEIFEMSPYSKPSREPSYYNTTLNELESEGHSTYEAVNDGVGNVGPQQEDTYQEIDHAVHYQQLNVNHQATYEGYVKPTSG